jgi:ketosteroid isomerase-like protein
MNKWLPLFILCFISIVFVSCFPKKKHNASTNENEKIALLKVDNEFAAMSETKGMKNAYLEYMDSNAVLLRPNSLPILDAEAVDYIIALKDTGYTISWKPLNVVVANSEELGYTFGVYEIAVAEQATILRGTYVSIWKKQADGKWKLALQSNNEGIDIEE